MSGPWASRVPEPGTLQRVGRWVSYAAADWHGWLRRRPDTSYLIAYPKTGSTWLRFMLCRILIRAYQLPYDELTVELNRLTRSTAALPDLRWTHDAAAVAKENGERLDPYELQLYGGRRRYARSRVALLVRDPRDVVVSLYHQLTRRMDGALELVSLSQFVRDPLYGFDRVLRFYDIWYHHRHTPRGFYLLRYEDLLEAGGSRLAELTKFFGIPAAAVDVEEVYSGSRAEQMRSLERGGRVRGMRLAGGERDTLKVRKAQAGTYLEEMSPEDIAFCNQRMGVFARRYGYEI